ncbi:hypothetical protein Q0N12_17310 [Rossellomorea marisflavi]
MLRTFLREWHKFWFFTFNYRLDTTRDRSLLNKYQEKSRYHGDKLVQLL